MSMNLDYRLGEKFSEAIVKNLNIDGAFIDIADLINDNFDVGQIVGDDAVIEYARKTFSCDEIFSENDLEDWARSNGWTKE